MSYEDFEESAFWGEDVATTDEIRADFRFFNRRWKSSGTLVNKRR